MTDDRFWPHRHAAHLLAKQFLFGDPAGQKLRYSGHTWLHEDDGDLDQREALDLFYNFLLRAELLRHSTKAERIEAVEEVEMAARLIVGDEDCDSGASPFWGVPDHDFWGTFE